MLMTPVNPRLPKSQVRRGFATAARGSMLIWLAGLILGIGTGMVFAYHLIQAAKVGPPPRIVAGSAAPTVDHVAIAHRKAIEASRIEAPLVLPTEQSKAKFGPPPPSTEDQAS